MKIAAVVVTYNRCKLLQRAIGCLIKQTRPLDGIIVVNNSSPDDTAEWLATQEKITIITQPNVGGAGGFYCGIKAAYDDGYDKIWCMDDDVYPDSDCLEQLLNYDTKDTGILCPMRVQAGKIFLTEITKFNLSNPLRNLHRNKLSVQMVKEHAFNYIEGIAFEGPLIDRKVVEAIGLPNKDLYILYDDSDYGYRAILKGFNIKIVSPAILNKELFNVGANKVQIIKTGKWKTAYHVRNSVYFNMTYGKNLWVRILRSIGILIKFESYIFKNLPFNDKYELKDIKIVFNAFRSGICKKLGKI